MNILVIDDDEGMRVNLRLLLEGSGHTVRVAEEGGEGLRCAAEPTDLILCDVDMPGMDGFATIAAIRRLPNCREVPFIFLTGDIDRTTQRRGMNLGADDFITKPFTVQEILDAIEARVNRQRTWRERVQELADQREKEVAADWSHELLTPMNAVLGGVELIELEADTIQPGDLRELLAVIKAGAERHLRLSHKLIRYFNLESLRTEPQRATATTPAKPAVIAGVNRVAREENRLADIDLACEAGIVRLDGPLLVDAVAELVENACHFSASGQPVRVRGTQGSGTYTIEVVDQGPGMTPEQRAGIGAFTQFERHTREQQGLGLGLAIARTVALFAGGRLVLDGGPGGCGLKARLELPCAPTT